MYTQPIGLSISCQLSVSLILAPSECHWSVAESIATKVWHVVGIERMISLVGID